MNQTGDTLTNNYYYPYGGNRGGAFSNLTTKRFTGQYHESSLPGGEGLSYYNARWYDPKLGRFLSADTIVPGPANPQAFNRYSYVFNNPLRFTDPTGHDPCDNGSRTCNSLNGGSRPTNIYLPIVTNQRSRPAAGSACPGSFVCLPPTPTAFPTPAPMAPRLIPTWTPTATPTTAPLIGPAPRPTPTATAFPYGSINYPSLGFGAVKTWIDDLPAEVIQRSGGRTMGVAGSHIAGVLITIAPNVGNNLANDFDPTSADSWKTMGADLTTDTVGYGASYVSGKLGGAVVGLFGGKMAQFTGELAGNFGGSIVWDLFVAPRFRSEYAVPITNFVVDNISNWTQLCTVEC